jgi:hypothetical protein
VRFVIYDLEGYDPFVIAWCRNWSDIDINTILNQHLLNKINKISIYSFPLKNSPSFPASSSKTRFNQLDHSISGGGGSEIHCSVSREEKTRLLPSLKRTKSAKYETIPERGDRRRVRR